FGVDAAASASVRSCSRLTSVAPVLRIGRPTSRRPLANCRNPPWPVPGLSRPGLPGRRWPPEVAQRAAHRAAAHLAAERAGRFIGEVVVLLADRMPGGVGGGVPLAELALQRARRKR